MNWTHAKRIAWKDYRRLVGLWVALVLIWGLGLGYSLFSAFWLNMSTGRLPSVMTAIDAILVTTVFYVLGWAAITYSAEHEERTYGYLRSLPLSPTSLFYGKLLWGVPSALLLIVALALLCLGFALVHPSTARPLSRELPDVIASTMTWLGLLPLAMASGLFWSMRLKRPLVSVGVAGLSMVMTTYVCYAVFYLVINTFYGTGWRWDSASDIACALLLFAVAATLFVVDRFQVSSWLPTFQSAVVGTTAAPVQVAKRRARLGYIQQSRPWLKRLLFIQDRFVAFASIGLVCVCAIVWSFSMRLGMWIPILAGLLGTLVFRPEHDDKRYRFLAQIGVPAFPYWISRLLVPFVASGIVAFQVLGIMTAHTTASNAAGANAWNYGPYVAIAVLAYFSVGQFCSIAFASPVIAFGMSAFAMVICGLWLTICALIDVSFLWALLPTLGFPLLASYLRVSRWFRDTGSWRQWVIPAIPIIALLVAVPAGTAFWRINAIPPMNLPEPLAVRPQPTVAQVLGENAYRSLLREKFPMLVRSDEPSDVWERVEYYMATSPLIRSQIDDLTAEDAARTPADDEREFVDEFVKATKNPAIFPREYADIASNFNEPSLVATAVLLKRAAQLTDEGQLDEAMELYKAGLRFARHRNDGYSGFLGVVYGGVVETGVCRQLVQWAMHPDNSAENIESMAAFLEEYRNGRPPLTEPVVGAYHWYRDYFQNSFTLERQLQGRELWLYRYRSLVPWEMKRLHRFHDLVAVTDYNALQQLDSGQSWSTFSAVNRAVSPAYPWQETTLFADQVSTSLAHSVGEQATHVENVRRGTIYQLVSIAHHKRNSEYPHDFQNVRFAAGQSAGREYSLPPDVYSDPPKQMQLGVCALRDGQQATCIMGHTEIDLRMRSTTDVFGPERHFPLPDFEKWSNETYRRNFLPFRQPAMTTMTNAAEQLPGYLPAGDFEAPGFDEFEGAPPPPPRFQAGDADVRPFRDEDDRADQLEQLLLGLDQRSRADVLQKAVRQVLQSNDSTAKREVLSNLSDPRIVGELLDDMLVILDSDEPALAAIAARQMLMSYPQLADSQREKLADRCSAASSGALGIPIRNPENGHYYEVIENDAMRDGFGLDPSQFTWQQAYEQASERTFRGSKGHLATITSREEEQFMASTFVVSEDDFFGGNEGVWIGGSDRDEEGVWRWMCGPEKGQIFWRNNAAVLGVYSTRFTGSTEDAFGVAAPQQEDYLLWGNLSIPLVNQRDLQTEWRTAAHDALTAKFIVEYSTAPDRGPGHDADATSERAGAELPNDLNSEASEEQSELLEEKPDAYPDVLNRDDSDGEEADIDFAEPDSSDEDAVDASSTE